MSKSINASILASGLGLAMTIGGGLSSADEQKAGYYGLGREAAAAQIAGWDIDVRPDGLGLPTGNGTVAEGDALFQEKCAQCHGVFGEGAGRWPVLVGGEGSLTADRPEKTIGSYWPYATTLWDYIHRAMPFFNPQSLTNDEVYALTAYLLNMNDIVDEDFVANQDNLAGIDMPNRNGFYRDPRPDVPSERCMQHCKDPDAIQITWDASELGVTPMDHLDNPEADKPEAVQPTTAAVAATGKAVYDRVCASCHTNGVAGAPRLGDKSAWVERITQGADTLIQHAIKGFHGKIGYMPARGGNSQLDDAAVAAAVGFMIESSKTKDESL